VTQPPPCRSVGGTIEGAADRFGDAEFLRVPDGTSVTFGDYERLTARMARVWYELGVRRGDLVVVALRNGLPFLLAWHGLNRLGAIMVPLNLHFRSREAGYVLAHSQAAHVVTTPEHADEVVLPACAAIADPPRIHLVEELLGRLEQASLMRGLPELGHEEPAAVLYTSGTTGPPKGCITTHAHYTVNGELLASSIRLEPGSTKLIMLPLFHMNAENSTMAALVSGARAYLRDGFSASSFWTEVVEHGVTHTHYLGAVLPVLDKTEDPLPGRSPLKVLWGAGCSPAALERLESRWGVRIIEVFGMTETGMDLCNPYDGPRRPGSCGLPVPGRRIRLLDDDGAEVGVGEVGQIVIERAPGMTTGYLHNEAATAALYRDGWLYTGDVAFRDADGYHYFVDRAKDIIRRSGENIGSAEVEGVLREHPGVEDAACVPYPDELRDEEVHAVVQLVAGLRPEDVPPAELITWCEARLASYKVPRYLEYATALPRTPTGKIQKTPLRTLDSSRTVLDRTRGWHPIPAAT
jgi:carnitine-CoA ligase